MNLLEALNARKSEVDRIEKNNQKLLETRSEQQELSDRRTELQSQLGVAIKNDNFKTYKNLKSEISDLSDQIEYLDGLIMEMEKNLSKIDPQINENYLLALREHISSLYADRIPGYEDLAKRLSGYLHEFSEMNDICRACGAAGDVENVERVFVNSAVPRVAGIYGTEPWDGLQFKLKSESPESFHWKPTYRPKIDIFEQKFINNLLKTIDKKKK